MNDVSNIATARFKRDLEGRMYSWESFRIWLHDRLYRMNKHRAKETAAKERKRINDKVLQNLGITPGQKNPKNKR